MAIQFRCAKCAQPIEVDDVYAGQTAACPYCRHVINVPAESTLDRAPITAKPADGETRPDAVESGDAFTPTPDIPTPYSGAALHVGPDPSRKERTARTYGNYALICTILVSLLFVSFIVVAIAYMAGEMLQDPSSQPSPERMMEIQQKLAENVWLAAMPFGMAFFALAGTALGITSLTQNSRGNWRAIVSVSICGLFVLCTCGGQLIAIMGGVA